MNKNKSLPFIIGGAAILLALIVVFATRPNTSKTYQYPATSTSSAVSATSGSKETTNPNASTSTSTSVKITTKAPGTYTLADVAKHNNASDCWTTIDGGVYNLTSWIDQHPGGREAILSLCGIDGSAAFNAQHGGQARPEAELASLKVGTLSK